MRPDIHKTVIVTGASQGIGAGLVKAFLDRRYNVVATSRSITKRGGFKASGDGRKREGIGWNRANAVGLDCLIIASNV